MDSSIERNEKARRLKLYLGDYFTKNLNPAHGQLVSPFVNGEGSWKDKYVMAVRIHTDTDERSLGASAVLAYGRYIWWETHGCYSLVERYFESASVVNECSQPEFLVLVFSRQVVPNKITVPLMSEIIQSRSSRRLRTLVLSYRDVPDLGLDFVSGFALIQNPSDLV